MGYNPSLVLVQPRKTHPYITERLLMGHKESNQAKWDSLAMNDNGTIFSLVDGLPWDCLPHRSFIWEHLIKSSIKNVLSVYTGQILSSPKGHAGLTDFYSLVCRVC